MKINDFQNSIKMGYIGEDQILIQLPIILSEVIPKFIQQYTFEKHPNIQLKGIDGSITIKWDIKTRSFSYMKYNDIFMEIQSGSKQGWFYYSEADIIIYLYLKENGKDIITEKVIVLFLEECRKYFTKERLEQYPLKEPLSNSWKTIGRIVPIKDFPENCLVVMKVK